MRLYRRLRLSRRAMQPAMDRRYTWHAASAVRMTGSINIATHPHTNIILSLPAMRGRGCGASALTFEQRGRCTFLCPCRVPVPPPPATAVSSLPVLCMARQCVMMMTTSIAGRPRKRPRSSPTWVRQAGRHPYFLPSRLWQAGAVAVSTGRPSPCPSQLALRPSPRSLSLSPLSPKSANGSASLSLRRLRPPRGSGESQIATGVSRRVSPLAPTLPPAPPPPGDV